ncbi:MAG TPA: radical SAM protein [Thermoanaerobaculia bacterium]|nr:radical SAM protein [Thermoanaerobaculia bacterium]
MKVLLANAPTRVPAGDGRELFYVKAGSRWPFSIEKKPSEPCRYVPFPFSLAYLAALLEKDAVPVDVLDAVALNLPEDEFVARCVATAPTLVVMEATTPTIEHDLALCARLKEATHATIALAGAHTTVFPRETLLSTRSVDWILTGEYEMNALEAIRIEAEGGPERDSKLAAVRGLVRAACVDAKGERVIVEGPPGLPIKDLDALPFPARHLFPTREAPSRWPYWDGFCQRRPAVQMHASRGCPFKCTFCLWISVIYDQGPYRTFSARRIVDEMEEIVRTTGAREIYFDDDIFTVREDHVVALCEEILRRDVRVAWSVMGDAMAITEKAVDAMAKAGCIGMKFGVESADPEVLKKLRKPINIEKVRKVAGWCAARGIKTHATITFGLEADTPQTMQDTLDFCCDLPVDSIQFSTTTPFPGTEHYRNAKAAGLIDDRDWSRFDGARSSVLTYASMRAEDVETFTLRAPSVWLRARLRDPAWLARQLKYFGRVAADQGIAGVVRRADRGARLLFNMPR